YKTVLITGAAKRIGENLALHFAKNGWNIAIHFNKSASSAKKLKNTIQSYGVDCITIKADLSNLNQVKNILRKIKKELGSLNCIINNASIFENDDILNFTDKSYQKHQNVNFLAPV
ncbi:MAG: SDR family NAD(P)-dependent oxidoreductase, partial [Candidatus Fonsibacter sp.]